MPQDTCAAPGAALSLEDDPRVVAFLARPRTGHDYAAYAVPYVEVHAEHIDRTAGDDRDARRAMRVQAIHTLSERPAQIPVSVLALGFKADPDEMASALALPAGQVGPTLRDLPYPVYLKTEHWQRTREAALERADHGCAVCGGTDRLEVHHNTYDRLGCERPADLAVLCRTHHELFHGVDAAPGAAA